MSDDATGVALLGVIWFLMFVQDRIFPYGSRSSAFLSVVYLGSAAWQVSDGGWGVAVVDAAISGWFAYLAWKRRKPRQRKPSKVAAKVRDLGHRLVVVPS